MKIEEYLKLHQPVIYKTFCNAINNGKLSHAYLISGDVGTPLLKIASFLGKSILCDSRSPLACDSCLTCHRINEQNYPDFFVVDGSLKSITDNDIASIQEKLETYAIEPKGVRVYVLNQLENISEKAINSLLKTLEEPESEVYAFLTTTNINLIKPTIVSRCQTLRLAPVARTEIIQEAVDEGIDGEDAELLSYIYNDSEMIKEFLDDEDNHAMYLSIKDLYKLTIETLKNESKEGITYHFMSQVNTQIKQRNQLGLFINLLIETFEDLFAIRKQDEIILKNYATILKEIESRIASIETILQELLAVKNLRNSNIGLEIDHISNLITKEIL